MSIDPRGLALPSRRPAISRVLVVVVVVAGALIGTAMIASWPLTLRTSAELMLPGRAPGTAELVWAARVIAPLVLVSIFAFPWLAPFLHLLVLAGVGAGLVGAVAAVTGLGWGISACSAAGAGLGLAGAVELVRRLVAKIHAGGAPKPNP